MERKNDIRKKGDEKIEARKKGMAKPPSQEDENDEGFKRNIDDEPPLI